MGIIQNYTELNLSDNRKMLLEIIESGLFAIQPDQVLSSTFHFHDPQLVIQDQEFDLSTYDRVFLVGIGKGSSYYAAKIEETLEKYLYAGQVIDVTPENFSRVHFVRGTHPLPSDANYHFTQNVLSKHSRLTERDLVLVLICGGGSAMLVSPAKVTLEQLIQINEKLLKSGADIIEMNTVRKHLSNVKGGGLAKAFYPATVASLIFSDVPGNDVSFIASGPTVADETTIDDAKKIVEKYQLFEKIELEDDIFVETPKEDKYFERVQNILTLSNITAIDAMKARGKELGLTVEVLSDKLQGEARDVGGDLLTKLQPGKLILAGGETTVSVKGEGGKGGRNLEVALGALKAGMDASSIVTSIATDGYDNTEYAGGIADALTQQHARDNSLDPNSFLTNNDSYTFFEKSGDGICTGRLPSNVSDLFIALKHG